MLLTCQTCGKEYSEKIKACPNCGEPNRGYLELTNKLKDIEQHADYLYNEIKLYKKSFIENIGLMLLVIALIIWNYVATSDASSQSIFGFFSFVFHLKGYSSLIVIILPWLKCLNRPYITSTREGYSIVQNYTWTAVIIQFIILFFVIMFVTEYLLKTNNPLAIIVSAVITIVFFFYPIYIILIKPTYQIFQISKLNIELERYKKLYVELMNEYNNLYY